MGHQLPMLTVIWRLILSISNIIFELLIAIFISFLFQVSYDTHEGDHGIKVVALAPSFAKTDLTAYFVECEKKGDFKSCEDIYNVGGWTDVEDIVSTCIQAIERKDIPQGSVIKIWAKGSSFVFPDSVAGQEF